MNEAPKGLFQHVATLSSNVLFTNGRLSAASKRLQGGLRGGAARASRAAELTAPPPVLNAAYKDAQAKLEAQAVGTASTYSPVLLVGGRPHARARGSRVSAAC